MERRRARLKATAAVVVLLILLAAATVAGRFALGYYKTAERGRAYAGALMAANQRLPRTIGGTTRIDRVSLGRRRLVMYHYTLVGYPAPGQNPFQIYDTFASRKARVVERVCALALTRATLQAEYSIVYRYKDGTGKKLLDVAVRAADCQR